MEAPQHSLSALLLAASMADHAERWHQETCRGRQHDDSCQRCLDLEADVFATEDALRDHMQAQCDRAS